MRQTLDRYQGTGTSEPKWLVALALALDRLTRQAQNHDQAAEVTRLVEATLALDEEALALSPDDPALVLKSTLTATRYSLMLFTPEHPEESLVVARKALERIRRVPRRYQNKHVLRSWGSLLQHLVTTLIWAGKREEAQRYVDEGHRVFEQLAALEPKDVQGRGIHADFLLALGKPCEALALLDGVHRDGVRGDYFASRLLAALACGDDAPFQDSAAEIKASTDPQVHWQHALWLVKSGQRSEAATELRTWMGAAAAMTTQWPLGVLDGLPARIPEGEREAVRTFIGDMEKFLRSEEETSSLPICEQLANGLEP